MHLSAAEPIFENRYDAGRQLAEKLAEYASQSVVVLGIPNGGVAVALSVSLALGADLDLVVSRKIPLPLSPEGGFGSVTDDGTTILNEEAVEKAGLSQQQINYQVSQVRADIRDRSQLNFRSVTPHPPLLEAVEHFAIANLMPVAVEVGHIKFWHGTNSTGYHLISHLLQLLYHRLRANWYRDHYLLRIPVAY